MTAPTIIAGPCGAETEEQILDTYVAMAGMGVQLFRAGVWKPRTRPGQWEGAGEAAFEWLQAGSQQTGIPFGVEVGNGAHVEAALRGGASMVWLGARTTSNPFSVQEIAEALRGSDVEILVKNPLSTDLELWSGAVERLISAGIEPDKIGLIHRGFSTGERREYRNPPLWHLAIEMHRRYPNLRMLCDPSHIAGRRELVGEVARRAAELHYGGLFIECHCNPESALSDAEQQLSPNELKNLLTSLVWRTESCSDSQFMTELEQLRNKIDTLDGELLSILAERMSVSARVGEIKRLNNVAIPQPARWNELLTRITTQAATLNLPSDFIRQLFDIIHRESIRRQ